MSTKHIKNADGKGWLIVKYSSNGSIYPPLPQFLRVDYLKQEGGRDYFNVLEGRSKGREASVVVGGYLLDGDPKEPAGKIKFDRKAEKLWYGGQGPVKAITQPNNPVPLGTFDLEIPDEPHILGEPYESQTIYAKTWFRIGNSGDRYLHPGRVSAGCITIVDIPKWTDIYNYLIKRRKGDQSVATVEVVETAVFDADDAPYVIYPVEDLSEEQLLAFRRRNPGFSIERNEKGELLIAKLADGPTLPTYPGRVVPLVSCEDGDVGVMWRLAVDCEPEQRLLRLDAHSRYASESEESGEIDLAQYAGEVLKVRGEDDLSGWLYSATIIEQYRSVGSEAGDETGAAEAEVAYERLWAIKSQVEDALDKVAPSGHAPDLLPELPRRTTDEPRKLAVVVGHTRQAPGAYGIKPIDQYEYHWNTDLAKMIKEHAGAKGVACAIFFRDDGGLAGAYSRVEKWGAEASMELHFNNASPTTTGTEVLYGTTVPASKKLAKIVQSRLVALYGRTGKANRGIKLPKRGERGYGNVHTLKTIPNCLTEPFFGDHPKDAKQGQSLKGKLAEALVEGFLEFIKSQPAKTV